MISPFDLSTDQMNEIAGRQLSVDELMACRAVLQHVRKLMHKAVHNNNGLTHYEHCWAAGPVHYMCAYNKINELIKTFSGRQGETYDTTNASDSS